MTLRSSFALLLLFIVAVPAASAQDAQSLLDRLRTKYDSVDALRAEFTQTMTSEYLDAEESFGGTLLLQGERYRVEAGGQTIVNDGATVWIYNAAEGQVLINAHSDDGATPSINDFLFKYPDLYRAQAGGAVSYGGSRHHVLTLRPRQADAFFSEIKMWLRDADDVVTRLEVTDVNDTKMTFALTNIAINPPLGASPFVFKAPAGAEVIDLRP